MESHREVRNGCRLPVRTSMNEVAINIPMQLIWRPLNRVAVKVLCRIKAEVDENRSASVSVVESRALSPRVVKHVCQHLSRTLANKLNIDFLSRRVPMQKYSCDHARQPRRPQNCLKAPV